MRAGVVPAVQYIRDTYGMSDLQRILERLGQGISAEAALRATIHSDYGNWKPKWANTLSANTGIDAAWASGLGMGKFLPWRFLSTRPSREKGRPKH
jgi:hypothetical protein